jgi:hypothetical protein
MSVTGYEVSYRGDTVGLCPDHREELGIAVEDCASTVKSTMYRHGNGGSPCAVCGFDVLSILSRSALSPHTDTPREYAVEDDRDPLSLGLAAELLSLAQNIDAWAFIDLAPGEEPTEEPVLVSDDGTVIAKNVHHGDATETLYVELSNRTGDHTYVQMHERATNVERLLQAFGLQTTVTPDPFDDDCYWHVLAFSPDA